MHLTTLTEKDEIDYDRIHQPHQLSREEKDELLFALLEHLKLQVWRATFDPSFTLLTEK